MLVKGVKHIILPAMKKVFSDECRRKRNDATKNPDDKDCNQNFHPGRFRLQGAHNSLELGFLIEVSLRGIARNCSRIARNWAKYKNTKLKGM